MIILCMYSTKGGVAKTTLCCNLGAWLADAGRRVLIIDADPQQSASAFFSLDHKSPKGLYEFVTGGYDNLSDCISRTDIDNLHIIPGNDPTKILSAWIKSNTSHGQAMRVNIKDAEPLGYDYVFIDTQGSNGSGDLQELAVRASNIILFPIEPDAITVRESLNNGMYLLDAYQPMDAFDTHNRIPMPHCIAVKYRPQISSHQSAVNHLRTVISPTGEYKGFFLNTSVPYLTAYNDAQMVMPRQPIHRYNKTRRPGQASPCGAETMAALANELFPDDEAVRERSAASQPQEVITDD